MKALNSCTNSFTGCGTVPASGSDVVFKWTTQTRDVSVLNGSHVAHKLNLEVNTFGQPTLLFNHRLERVNERTTRWPSQQPENTQPPLVSDQHPSHPLSPFVIKIMIRASFYIYASVCTLRLTAFRADLFLCLSFCRYQDVKVSRGGESRGELTIGGCRWDALCWAACGERSSCVIIFYFLFFFKYLTHKLMCWIGSNQVLTFSSSSYTDSERNGPESNHQVRVGLRSPPSSSISFQTHLMLRSFLFTHYGQRYEAKRIRLWSKSSL